MYLKEIFLNNFTELKTVIDVNHVTFADATGNQGKHDHVAFPEQGRTATGDSPLTDPDEATIYCRQSAVGGAHSALFFRPENLAAGVGADYDFTSISYAAGPPSKGYTRLPSGLILKWGSSTVNAGSASAATAFDATVEFAPIYMANVSLVGLSGMDKALFVQTLTNTHITVYNANANGGTKTFYYFAIGIGA